MYAKLLVVLFGVAFVSGEWALHKVDTSLNPLAVCLDGTAGAFYVSPGSGDGIESWEIHLQGGGWCDSDEDCLARSKGVNPFGQSISLGSSASWGSGECPNADSPVCVADGGPGGMMSRNAKMNPFSHNWNKVFVGYCDGGSFSGALEEPVSVTVDGKEQKIYYRGRYILDAVIESLSRQGLKAAKEVVLTGSSSGGLATFLQADHVTKMIKAYSHDIRVSAAPASGFFLDVPSFEGANVGRPLFSWMFERMNMAQGINSECLITFGEAKWMCMFAPFVLPFVHTPFFVINSMADAAQIEAFMELGCNPTVDGNCNEAQVDFLNLLRDDMRGALHSVMNSQNNGAFLTECYAHLLQNIDGGWNGIKVEDQTMVETLMKWYNQPAPVVQENERWSTTPDRAPGVAVADGVWGSNPTCNVYDRSRDQTLAKSYL